MSSPTTDNLVAGNMVMHDHSESDLGAILDPRYLKLTGGTVTGELVINSEITSTPINVKLNSTSMFQVNQYGVGIGSVAPSNTDDFVHIERNVDTSTGILIYNRNNTASQFQADDGSTSAALSVVPEIVGGTNSKTGTEIAFTVASGLTAYRPYFLESANSTACYIGFAAEL